MAEQTGPHQGVKYGWDVGESGWKPGMDANLRLFDMVLQLTVESRLNTPPGSPPANARYIVGTLASGAWIGHANEIAYWNGSAWEFWVPREGWHAYVKSGGTLWRYTTGGGWADLGI